MDSFGDNPGWSIPKSMGCHVITKASHQATAGVAFY